MEGRLISFGLKKGAWNAEEDHLLRKCIEKYGEGKWHQVPLRAGLNRCRKSCRLRWLNYLKPSIKRGLFSDDEADLIVRLHKLLGNRWSLIAGRLPGRTANDVKNYWNTHLSKKEEPCNKLKNVEKKVTSPVTIPVKKVDVIRPRPRSFSHKSYSPIKGHLQIKSQSYVNVKDNNKSNNDDDDNNDNNKNENIYGTDTNTNNGNNSMTYKFNPLANQSGETTWWESLFEESEEAKNKTTVGEAGQSTLMGSDLSTFDVDLWNLLNSDNSTLN